METESLDDQEVSNLATMSSSLNNTLHGGSGKGRKHSFFQVREKHFQQRSYFFVVLQSDCIQVFNDFDIYFIRLNCTHQKFDIEKY